MSIKTDNIYFQSTRELKDDLFFSKRKDMRKCLVCGKEFYAPLMEMWAYKRTYMGHSHKHLNKVKWFCSWHCLSEYEKTEKPKTLGQWATRR